MRRLSPLTLLSIGLVSLTVSIILAGDAIMGLVPNEQQHVFQQRKALSETLAVQYSMLAERGDVEIIQVALAALVERMPEVEAAALVTADGQTLVQAGLAGTSSEPSDNAGSTPARIQVPIYRGASPWGVLRLSFRPSNQPAQWAILAWLSPTWLHFVLFVAVAGFVAYRLLMKRVLRHLDPSKVVPPRVKAALDTLAEGVVMLDPEGKIVLANASFVRRVGCGTVSLLGHPLSDLSWAGDDDQEWPWLDVLKSNAPRAEKKMICRLPSGEAKRFVVNAASILDERGTIRGCMASFSDVTELEEANDQLRRAIGDLETSKIQVMRQNRELEVANVTLQNEIQERQKVQAEREVLSKRLMETSRRVGMADVASTVLHNVGNVLNSVNVSVDVVAKTVRQSPVHDVALIAAMLRDHTADLAAFLTQDSKGKQIPSYLTMVAEAVLSNSTVVEKELGSLSRNIDHIRQIVTRQVDLARPGDVVLEPVLFSELFDQALGINRAALEKAGIKIIQQYAALPAGMTDQHQVLQILVNLVTNAKNAMVEAEPGPHRLLLRLGPAANRPGFVRFEVTDTGVGITTANMSRLFTQGFTTRKDGLGIGLHSASLAAKNLGGDVRASSPGEGRGATFTLDLPIKAMAVAA
ncbi:MAG: PAS domain-containing protein [Nitrospira sp.]|nr:PAS domain-containing protein [Nitrospira sp.]